MKKTVQIFLCLVVLVIIPTIFKPSYLSASSILSNITWSLDEEGTLTIAGNGSIGNEHIISPPAIPWFDEKDSVTSIIIENGITGIGNAMFYICENLESVSIPESVTNINEQAFMLCRKLTSINVSDNNPNYSSYDGILFNKNKTLLVTYPIGKPDVTYNIPHSVERIGDCAFYRCRNTNIVMPNSITHIGNYAFSESPELTNITMSNNIVSIGDKAFYCCYRLENVTIPDKTIQIGEGAFYACKSLKGHITIPYGVTRIADYTFMLCENITGVTLPNSVTTIGYAAFSACDRLTDVYYGGTEEQWKNVRVDNSQNYNIQLFNATIHYNPTIDIMINGEKLILEQVPIIEAGRTLVPFRAIFEALGAAVEWEDATKTVFASKNDTIITLPVGNKYMNVNGNIKTLDVSPKIVDNITFVPVRAISEAFNCKVEWNENTKTVSIIN